jgi:hypothetical protein
MTDSSLTSVLRRHVQPWTNVQGHVIAARNPRAIGGRSVSGDGGRRSRGGPRRSPRDAWPTPYSDAWTARAGMVATALRGNEQS